MKTLFMKTKNILLWAGMTTFTVAAYFGFRCPAPGCPGCKIVGK